MPRVNAMLGVRVENREGRIGKKWRVLEFSNLDQLDGSVQ